MGDPSLLPHEFEKADPGGITASFGTGFTAEVADLPPGGWRGPVASAFGLHLVLVSGRSEPQAVAFEAVRDAVLRDFTEDRRQKANLDFIRRLKQRYQITVHEPTPDGAAAPPIATAIP